ncbi:MAG: FAD-dependent oxidoreductase, partial [Verrucomicrobiota bacterium]|nr:FAD-dependent oxidoreductase [Verrucomicrobiota bacterium]
MFGAWVHAVDYEADVVIYGGTSAAITAAVQVKKMGKKPMVVSPDLHLGGLSSSGLGWTDSGKKEAIGGLAREFYHRVWRHYQSVDSWTWQKMEEYGNRGQGAPAIDGERRTMWIFEPKVAEGIFESWIVEHDLEVIRGEFLDRDK